MIDPGKLTERVALASIATAPNSAGEPVESVTQQGTVWAQVSGARGEESFAAARANAARTIKVLVRWRDDIGPGWRLTWRDEAYDVVDVDRSRRGAGELWLMARTREAA